MVVLRKKMWQSKIKPLLVETRFIFQNNKVFLKYSQSEMQRVVPSLLDSLCVLIISNQKVGVDRTIKWSLTAQISNMYHSWIQIGLTLVRNIDLKLQIISELLQNKITDEKIFQAKMLQNHYQLNLAKVWVLYKNTKF